MAEKKWGKCLVNTPGSYPDELKGKVGTAKDPVPGVKATHLITATDKVNERLFLCRYYLAVERRRQRTCQRTAYPRLFPGYRLHRRISRETTRTLTVRLPSGWTATKKFSPVITLFSSRRALSTARLCLTKLTKPVLFLVIAMTGQYSRKPASQPSKPAAKKRYSLMDHTKENFSVGGDFKELPPPKTPITTKGARILHIEDDMIPDAFYVDVVKIYSGTGNAPAPEHVHEWPELLAMVGANPDKPREIEGEMAIYLDGEYHTTNKSSYVCIPAGLKHCPWEFHDIKYHTVVFSAGPQGEYSGSHKKEKAK